MLTLIKIKQLCSNWTKECREGADIKLGKKKYSLTQNIQWHFIVMAGRSNRLFHLCMLLFCRQGGNNTHYTCAFGIGQSIKTGMSFALFDFDYIPFSRFVFWLRSGKMRVSKREKACLLCEQYEWDSAYIYIYSAFRDSSNRIHTFNADTLEKTRVCRSIICAMCSHRATFSI